MSWPLPISMLLHYCTLTPTGPSNLAAIRFSSAIRIHRLRIFPAGARPFAQDENIVAHTEPEAFYLQLFFNAQPIHAVPVEDKPKQRPANALVPSSLAYTGGLVDFEVDMGAQYATRLMIIKGEFKSLSIAVYGDVASEIPQLAETYIPTDTTLAPSTPLTSDLNPANSPDPTALAENLLSLINDAPPLDLVVQLVFCLKPANEDWDLPDFPYIYADIGKLIDSDFDPEDVYEELFRPIAPSESLESQRLLAESIAAKVNKEDQTHPHTIAGILGHVAAQNADLTGLLLDTLNLPWIFDSYSLESSTVQRLAHIVLNPEIAKRLIDNKSFIGLVNDLQKSSVVELETRRTLRTLLSRLETWECFERALSGSETDSAKAIQLLLDAGTHEKSLGIWLQSMLTTDDFIDKLKLGLPLEAPFTNVNLDSSQAVSHSQFLSFVRAYIGVASVLAVYAWADGLPSTKCRERTLSVLRLWQNVDGYREIVNSLLLLPQMTYRLESMITDAEPDDPPSRSGMHAEHILLALAQNPKSMLHPDFVECILNLKPPLAHIQEEERLSLRSAALLADAGLSGALEELIIQNQRPMDLKRLRTLRVALAILGKHLLAEDGEWHVLQELWALSSHGLINHLIEFFVEIAGDLMGHFGLQAYSFDGALELVRQLLSIAKEIITLMIPLVPTHDVTSRVLRSLVQAIMSMAICTDLALEQYAHARPVYAAANESRLVCLSLLSTLARVESTGRFKSYQEVIFSSLMEAGIAMSSVPSTSTFTSREPTRQLAQALALIYHILPVPAPDTVSKQQERWIMDLPNLLPTLRVFYTSLECENKIGFIRRLVELDADTTGVGEWLLLSELTQVVHTLRYLDDEHLEHVRRIAAEYEIYLALEFLSKVVSRTEPLLASWCQRTFSQPGELTDSLASVLSDLLHKQLTSPVLLILARALAALSSSNNPPSASLLLVAILTLLRSVQHLDPEKHAGFQDIAQEAFAALVYVPAETLQDDAYRVSSELGLALSTLSQANDISDPLAAQLLVLLSHLSGMPETHLREIRGLGTHGYNRILARLNRLAGEGSVADTLKLIILDGAGNGGDGDDNKPAAQQQLPLRELPHELKLSIDDLAELFRPTAALVEPSTPNLKATTAANMIGNQDEMFDFVTTSPPASLLRSPAITGLTKTYLNNDFRQLRQTPSARQNTSRLPSKHVDDFELEHSPTMTRIGLSPEMFTTAIPAFNLHQ